MKQKILNKEECKEIQLNILKIISKICKKNNLNYFLCGGTLLGAVRHKGFIPWDDDIDICLPRKDYESLLCILKEQKDFKWLSIIDSSTPNYYYTFAKAVDNTTVAKMEDNSTNHGIWVDIFPYDNLPQNEKKRNRFLRKCYFFRGLIMSVTTDFSAKKIKRKYLKRIMKIITLIIGKNRVLKSYNKTVIKYNDQETEYFGNTFTPYCLNECFKKTWYYSSIELKFEDGSYNCPLNYDEVLKKMYGNYMQLPPINKRREHRIKAWRIK